MNKDNFSDYTGCGAIIFRQEDEKVFIAQRKITKSFGGGLWETIGGGIEKEDKNLLSCIKREIKEELNVEIKSAQEFKDYEITTKEGGKYLIKTFLIELDSDPDPNKNDFESYGWFTKEEIEKFTFVSNCKERLKEYFSINK